MWPPSRMPKRFVARCWTRLREKIQPYLLLIKRLWDAPSIILKYAGVRSWSAFYRNASMWSISEDDGVYKIIGYRKHSKSYWQQDLEQQIQFPVGTTVDDVVDRMIAILQDAAQQ